MNKSVFSLCAALVFAGCQSIDPETVGPPPASYKEQIASYVTLNFIDPYSIRDARITQPKTHATMNGGLWNVCMMTNAKNRLGGYTGMKATVFIFKDGFIIGTDSHTYTTGIMCADRSWQPFTEIVRSGNE